MQVNAKLEEKDKALQNVSTQSAYHEQIQRDQPSITIIHNER